MSRKSKPMQPKHYGVANNLTRKNHVISSSGADPTYPFPPLPAVTKKKTFMPNGVEPMPAGSPSISRAKRYMRTGELIK